MAIVSVVRSNCAKFRTIAILAKAAGLRDCPPLVAPLRVRPAWTKQGNAPGSVLLSGRTPAGSAHVLNTSPSDEPGIRSGLYLRVVDHVPWLRGSVCDDLLAPEDHWVLAR